MSIPLAVAAPAVVASLAYLNARTQFGYDYQLLKTQFSSISRVKALEKKDRLNHFYTLEDHAHSKTRANHAFLVFEGKSWTFKETYDMVLRYAAYLRTVHAVAPKEIIALDCMNSPKFVFMTLALWSLGARAAYINYNLTSKALLHCIKTSTARLVFVDGEIRHNFTPEVVESLTALEFREGGKGPVEMVDLDAALEAKISALDGFREADSARSGAGFVHGDRMALLIYTSGTTGLPKAASVSWGKCWAGSFFLDTFFGLGGKHIYYTCMPLYHGTATILCLMPCLVRGATCALGRKFSHQTFWPEVRASKATMIQYVGETCRYLLAAPPLLDPVTGESLDKRNEVQVALGNGLRPDVWERFKERFGIETICEFYAATEGTGSSWNVSRNAFSSGAIGRTGKLVRLLMGGRAQIVEVDWESEVPRRDPKNNNFCTKVAPNSPGELLYVLNADDIAFSYQGYFGNAKASGSKIMRDVFRKGDAWFRTGDVVRTDDEGRTWFCDRIGDSFRWRSENVSTNEVSEVLGRHPAVDEANVYGVELPHHDGRAGCAAVSFNRPVDAALLASVADHAARGLPRYAVPLFLRVTDEMQATGNNKQQKAALRAQGVDPAKVPSADRMFWLRGGTYVSFGERDWETLRAGLVKL